MITLILQLNRGLHPVRFPRLDELRLLLTLLERFSRTVAEHHHGISLCRCRCRLLRLLQDVTFFGWILIDSLVHLVTLNVEVSRRIIQIKDRDSLGRKLSFLKVSENWSHLGKRL